MPATESALNDHASPDPAPPEPVWPPPLPQAPEPRPGAAAYVYAATCKAIAAWSEDVGFEVVHIGVAADPLLRVSGLGRSGHAALSYFLSPYESDYSIGEWHLVPLQPAAAGAPWPEGCEEWAGTVRAALPADAGPEDLALRLALMLRPLEAHHCAQLPRAVERRASLQRFLPVLPRYTVSLDGAALAQDLYRVAGAEDLAFVATALGAALAMLGEDRPAFDPIVDALRRSPTASEAGFAADPPRAGDAGER